MRPREVAYLAMASYGAALAYLAALLRLDKAQSFISLWPISPEFGGGLLLRPDGLALVGALAVAAGGFLAILAWTASGNREGEVSLLYPAQALAAGAIACLFSSNGVTLCVAWGLTDLALLFLLVQSAANRGVALRAVSLTSLAGLVLLWVALHLGVEADPFSLESLPLMQGALLLLVVVARLGLYPLQVGWVGGWDSMPHRLAPLLMAPWAVGAYLAARLLPSVPWGATGEASLTALATVAILASSILAWCDGNDERALGYVAVHQAGLIFLVALPDGGWSVGSVGWYVVGCVLGMAAMFSLWPGDKVPPPSWAARSSRGFRIVAAASLLGAPVTVGFLGRVGLGMQVMGQGQILLWVWVTLSGILLAGRLTRVVWRTPAGGEGDWGAIPGWAAQGIAASLLVLLGLWPGWLATVLETASWGNVLDSMSSSALWALVVSTAALVLGPTIEYLVRPASRQGRWGAVIESLLSLRWLYRFAERLGMGAIRISWALVQSIEGRYYMSWILLVTLMVIILMLAA
jgi:NADH:ubiquinone oxidoreductase subunit 2 (subunit N)